ncbi:MAG TPA: glycosyltransferase family 1 protein, partial [Chromatiales bacterium]|nr:glycosyltransferase family 1 protein [Chromatiales bacterium]
MANQTRQLAGLLRAEGCSVELVRQNRPYVPAWIGAFPRVRALARLLSYLRSLWGAAG